MPNWGAFAGGLASGIVTGQQLALRQKAEERAQAADKRAQESHDIAQKISKIGVARLEAEQPVYDKELQLRGAQADYNMNEQQFKSTMQAHEQETRRLLSDISRATAQADKAALQDQLNLKRQKLNADVSDMMLRGTANAWNVLQLGQKDLALKMFNDSNLLMPGVKAKDIQIENVDVPGSEGKMQSVPAVKIIPEGDGEPRYVPVSQLETLANRYGAKYEKVGNNLVRIGPDGKITPVYESEGVMAVPEDSRVVSKRTGAPVAGSGVMPAGSSKRDTRVDSRVKMAIDKVILPRYGGRFEGGMFFPDEKNKIVATRATVLAGQFIRQGMTPEAAGAKAIEQAEREQKLSPTPGSPEYTGPRPWAR